MKGRKSIFSSAWKSLKDSIGTFSDSIQLKPHQLEELNVSNHARGIIVHMLIYVISAYSYMLCMYTDGRDFNATNFTITFNGSYSVGDNECVVYTVSAQDDGIVEGTESFGVVMPDISTIPIVFIIDNDCKVFFQL